MLVEFIDLTLTLLAASLTIHHHAVWRWGWDRRGRIGRALGENGYAILWMALASLGIAGLVLWEEDLKRTFYVAVIIVRVDEFLNGDDPPSKKRRVWMKNKFAKLAPARN